MAARFKQTRSGRAPQCSDSYLPRDVSPIRLNEFSHSASWWTEKEEHTDHGYSLREQLKEMDEHVARLHDMLRCERAKCTRLQLRSNQQEAELKRREQHISRMKERLSLQADKHRDRGPAIEVMNVPSRGRGKREPPSKSFRSAPKREEVTLRVMLERREAELREAMKLRHSLTTLLHALRVDMERTVSEAADVQEEAQSEPRSLDQAEVVLGEHVTGGVVQGWRHVQKRLVDLLSDGHTGVGTDHDKLLARLETDLNESQQLVRLQQQLLHDSLASPVPSELTDSYFLEEWERLQMHWVELDQQRRTFEKERQSFTDAAIRLSHERLDFEQQKASLLKRQYLCDSPLFAKGHKRRESTALNFSALGPNSISGCLPITPSSTKSGAAAVSEIHQGRVQTPSTPDLYSALNLSYSCRTGDHELAVWDDQADKRMPSPQASHFHYNFDDQW